MMSNKILIADDSKLVVSLVKSIFEGQIEPYQVISCFDGSEAIQKAQNEMPDLILMDWQMPEMSGIEALRVLKSDVHTQEIPVIMLTATESTGEAFEAGAIDFIQKPFNKSELIARVKTSLDAVNAKKEVKLKNVEIEIQRDKLKLQKDLLVKQKKEITDNEDIAIQSAKLYGAYLQNALIDNANYFSFVIPINEAPSTFLWFKKKGSIHMFCAAVLPKNMNVAQVITSNLYFILNDIVAHAKNEIDLQPLKVLQGLISALKDYQSNVCNQFIFYTLDTQKHTLQYSGKGLPLCIYKNEKATELKTEKLSGGLLDATNVLINHKVQLAKDDMLYVVVDGFSELAVEKSETVVLTDELKDILKKVHKKEMPKQKELLMKTFENWKKDVRQMSDISIVGNRV